MGELDPRIRIRAPLRCDGIGRLDCAEDTETGSRMAVRWLPLEANGNAAIRACETMPSHPTLPRIRQTGTVGNAAFVAMDFPEGQLLSTKVGERLDTKLVIRIGAQIASALAVIHGQGLVHGEMSSDSILVVADNRAYLWDLPLVIANRLTDRRGENRLMYNLVKTAPFLAPERARGEGSSQGGDVYTLGAILCIASGAPMPTAPTTLGVVHQVALHQWTPRIPAELPDPWGTMIRHMISAAPEDRPTAQDVADVFSMCPAPGAFPTVPELPSVRLPPAMGGEQAKSSETLDAPSEAPVVAEAAPATAPDVPREPISASTTVPMSDLSVSAIVAQAAAIQPEEAEVLAPVSSEDSVAALIPPPAPTSDVEEEIAAPAFTAKPPAEVMTVNTSDIQLPTSDGTSAPFADILSRELHAPPAPPSEVPAFVLSEREATVKVGPSIELAVDLVNRPMQVVAPFGSVLEKRPVPPMKLIAGVGLAIVLLVGIGFALSGSTSPAPAAKPEENAVPMKTTAREPIGGD